MNATSIGDMANALQLGRRNTAIKQDLTRLTHELVSGQVSDVRQAVNGSYGYLGEIERGFTSLSAYKHAANEANAFASAMQTSLAQIEDVGGVLAESLILSGSASSPNVADNVVADAKQILETIVGTLNRQFAGRSLFAGTATDTSPIISADDLLAQLGTAMAGAATPDDMIAAATAWFDDPAGFDAIAYQGADDPLRPMQISDTDAASLDIRANDVALRDVMRQVAVTALADDPAFGLTVAEQAELFGKTGIGLLDAQQGVIGLRTHIGTMENRIETVLTRNAAENASLELAKSKLLGVDPFDAATELENVQFQLQSLYTVTARNAQLSLVNFL